MIKVSSNINEIKIPSELKLKQSIIEKITEIVRVSIQRNYEQGLDYSGGSVSPKKAGGRIYVETGTLLRSITKQMVSDYGEVFISPERSDIAKYLDEGRSDMPARHSFGLNKNIQSEINDLLLTTSFQNLYEIKLIIN